MRYFLFILTIALNSFSFAEAHADEHKPIFEVEKKTLRASQCWTLDNNKGKKNAVLDYVTGLTQAGATDVRVSAYLQTKGSCGEYGNIRHVALSGSYSVYRIVNPDKLTRETRTLNPLRNVCYRTDDEDNYAKCDRQAGRIIRGLTQAGAVNIQVDCVRLSGSCGEDDDVSYYSVEGTFDVLTANGVTVSNFGYE